MPHNCQQRSWGYTFKERMGGMIEMGSGSIAMITELSTSLRESNPVAGNILFYSGFCAFVDGSTRYAFGKGFIELPFEAVHYLTKPFSKKFSNKCRYISNKISKFMK